MCVEWKTPDDGLRNCPKHVEFQSKNKLEKIAHLVGFINIASCQQTCMTYTTDVCRVKNSWWWTEELSETCRVSIQKKNWEIGATSWFLLTSQAVSKPVWHIPLLCVHWKTPDDGQRNCPKHVEFQSKKKNWEIGATSWFYYPCKLSANLYDIFHCYVCVHWKTPDDGQRNCPKHVEFQSKKKID